MVKIKDIRILKGKKRRNEEIRRYFEKRFNSGLRYEVVMDELILRYGLSESTIYQIIKRKGSYKN